MQFCRVTRCVLAFAFAMFCCSHPVWAQSNVVDASTLTGKFIMGYQGWHAAAGDGNPLGIYVHWGGAEGDKPSPSNIIDDIWPDLSEFSANELFDTDLTYGNGQPAKCYSSYKQSTVNHHFQWMRDYGIDGVMMQRFIKDVVRSSNWAALRNTNLVNVRNASETYGRVFCVEYDMSNDDPATFISHLTNDWAYLTGTLGITNSSRYLRHKGKPIVGIWGLGFNGIAVPPSDAQAVINYFKAAGCTVMGGVPYWWRTLNNDSQTDPAWLSVYHSFDIVCPWSVGKYGDVGDVDALKSFVAGDVADLKATGQDYLPVIYPGYSVGRSGTPNSIPRVGGRLYWRQAYDTISVGANMLFGAMFDEIDEGTATYKLAPTMATTPTNMPAGANSFALDVDGESLPSDWYLRIAGQINRVLRGDVPLNEALPISPTNQITVTSPNGSNVWTQGMPVTVTWNTTGVVSLVNIDLSSDDGRNWSRLISNIPNTGSKTLRVPHISATAACRIRVSENDGTPTDWSDNSFTIQSSTTNLGTHLEPLWRIVPGSRSYVTVAPSNTPNQRSVAYNALSNQVYIISRTGATTGLTVNVLNATTGADLYLLNTTAITGGSIVLMMMCVADDGALYAANMSNSGSAVAVFKLYRWANSASATAPVLVYSGEPANRTNNVRWGDSLTVRGTGTNTQIIIDAQGTNLCAVLTPTNGSMTTWTSTAGTQEYFGGSIGRSLQFGTGNTFWQKRKGDRLQQSSFTVSPLVTTVVTNYNLFNSGVGPVTMDFTQNVFTAINYSTTTNRPDALEFYDSSTLYNATLLGSYDFPTNQQPNINVIGQAVFGEDKIFAIDGNNGVLALQIVSTPQITTQPQSQSVSGGGTASFNVTAGGASLNYQWNKNGSAVFGATNSVLTLTNVSGSSAATYTVVVNNSAGSAISSNAVLTVTGGPIITSQPLSRIVSPGANVDFSVSASGAAPLFYQWRFNGTNLGGQNSTRLSLTNLDFSQAGKYGALVSNSVSATTSSNALLSISTFQSGTGLVLGGEVGSHFQIDWSTNLSVTNWTVLTNFFLPSNPFTIPDNSNPSAAQRFYRVTLLP
ncbi:MAG: hypothetical protein JWM68_3623 [Verrucomicrobiales bacterium]|nr:hypothetical protein [Verrucomicrobiales bacterium]